MAHACTMAVVWLVAVGAVALGGETELTPEHTYRGLANRQTLNPETGQTAWNDTPLTITSQEAYEAFVAQIPEYEMSKTQPAPKSNDPLLAKPPVDFSKHTMLVVFHPVAAAELNFTKIVSDGTKIRADYEAQVNAQDSMLAQDTALGAYTAVVIPVAGLPAEYNRTLKSDVLDSLREPGFRAPEVEADKPDAPDVPGVKDVKTPEVKVKKPSLGVKP
jgi:hypothetical protein